MKIRCVIDTHVHADHVSGGRRLAEATGADYVLHESAGARLQFRGIKEDEELDLGNVRIQVLHTPGHTPEHMSLLVTDKTRGPEPWFLLSGHTLMVGDLGRTELASSAEEGARSLFRCIQKLKNLPDYLEVLPEWQAQLDHRFRAPLQPRVWHREGRGICTPHAGEHTLAAC